MAAAAVTPTDLTPKKNVNFGALVSDHKNTSNPSKGSISEFPTYKKKK